MAEVQIERKEGVNFWPWLLALVVIAGIVWWIIEANDRDVAEVRETAPVATAPVYDNDNVTANQPELATPNMPFAAIMANPDAYYNKAISGMATVTAVAPSGDGFWIEQDGVQMFAVRDAALITQETVEVGQRVSLTGVVYNPGQMAADNPNLANISQETRTSLADDKAFLVVRNIEPQNQVSSENWNNQGTRNDSAGY